MSGAEEIFCFPNGDKIYRYDQSLVLFLKGERKVLSTSVYNGGIKNGLTAVFDHDGKKGAGMPCEMLADTYEKHMRLTAARLGLDPDRSSGAATAADMENAAIESMSYKELTVTAVVTAGIETNAGRAGDPASYYEPVEKPQPLGTIVIMLYISCSMPPGTLARALVTCTEAKTAAIQELAERSRYSSGPATGSGTDQTFIISDSESPIYMESAGKHSKLGELIGKTVIKAVKKGLARQSGLTPEKQHHGVRRMSRFGVTEETLWQRWQKESGCKTEKPIFIRSADETAKETVWVISALLISRLLDERRWGLISAEELTTAAEQILQDTAGSCGISGCQNHGGTQEEIICLWTGLFLQAVRKKLSGEIKF